MRADRSTLSSHHVHWRAARAPALRDEVMAIELARNSFIAGSMPRDLALRAAPSWTRHGEGRRARLTLKACFDPLEDPWLLPRLTEAA